MDIFISEHISTLYNSSPTMIMHNIGSTVSELSELTSLYMLTLEAFDFGRDRIAYSSFAPNGNLVFSKSLSQFSYLVNERPHHQHDYFELMIVLKGTILHYINDRSYECYAGYACLLNHNIKHVEKITEDAEVMYLAFSDNFFENLFHSDSAAPRSETSPLSRHPLYQTILDIKNNAAFYQKQYWDFLPLLPADIITSKFEPILDKIIMETIQQEMGYLNLVQGYILRIFSILFDSSFYHINSITSTSSKEEYLFVQIQRILEKRKGNISRTELADILNYNAHYLNRIVKKRSGMSIQKYAQIFSLREATRLLLHSDLSISQIIHTLGFSNHSFFYQLFEEKYGMTPKAYREKRQK